ncbi:hypothetical protein BHE74_00026890, partial [Ensete ventricosum]
IRESVTVRRHGGRESFRCEGGGFGGNRVDLAPFDPTKKKKKKKVVLQDPAEVVDKLAEKTETLTVADSSEPSFAGMKKKKKKQVDTNFLNDENGDVVDDHTGNIVINVQVIKSARRRKEKASSLGLVDTLGKELIVIISTKRCGHFIFHKLNCFFLCLEFTLEMTLEVVFCKYSAGEEQRDSRFFFSLPQLIPFEIGHRCHNELPSQRKLLIFRMHRQHEHVMNFLLAEMGTNGSLDGQQRLIVKGRFAPKNFEGILRRYVSKFLHELPNLDFSALLI